MDYLVCYPKNPALCTRPYITVGTQGHVYKTYIYACPLDGNLSELNRTWILGNVDNKDWCFIIKRYDDLPFEDKEELEEGTERFKDASAAYFGGLEQIDKIVEADDKKERRETAHRKRFAPIPEMDALACLLSGHTYKIESAPPAPSTQGSQRTEKRTRKPETNEPVETEPKGGKKQRRKRTELRILIEAAVDAYGADATNRKIGKECGIASSMLSEEPYKTWLKNARKEYIKKMNAERAADYKMS
ncbi:MAG: hypothetical protein FWE67_05265 [Planctomycetaceae bacterium]|nr:hypothetical protein [Planctomycetaceae bacterium]